MVLANVDCRGCSTHWFHVLVRVASGARSPFKIDFPAEDPSGKFDIFTLLTVIFTSLASLSFRVVGKPVLASGTGCQIFTNLAVGNVYRAIIAFKSVRT